MIVQALKVISVLFIIYYNNNCFAMLVGICATKLLNSN